MITGSLSHGIANATRRPRGAHLDNLILSDLMAWSGSAADTTEIIYWWASTGEEVDFVIERNGQLLLIEVRTGRRPRLSDIRGLRVFRQEYPDLTRSGQPLHGGDDLTWLADGILAAPWWRVI